MRPHVAYRWDLHYHEYVLCLRVCVLSLNLVIRDVRGLFILPEWHCEACNVTLKSPVKIIVSVPYSCFSSVMCAVNLLSASTPSCSCPELSKYTPPTIMSTPCVLYAPNQLYFQPCKYNNFFLHTEPPPPPPQPLQPLGHRTYAYPSSIITHVQQS